MSACATCLLAFALQALVMAGPALHRPHVYPEATGPIFAIAEGPDGLLWLAASDGLYRFDGFHYQRIPAYPFTSARFVAFTRDGSLWCGDFEGLARTQNGRFEIALRDGVASLTAYPDQLFARLGDGLARIGIDGSVHRLREQNRRDLLIDPSGRLWWMGSNPLRVRTMDPNRPEAIQPLEVPAVREYQEVIRDSQGRMWAADMEAADLIENGNAIFKHSRQQSHETRRPGPLLPGRNGQLWFVGETIRGLIRPVEFRDRKDHDRYSPLAGLEDNRGHFWVASLGQGLVEWTENPRWERWFAEDFGGEPPVQVARDARGSVVVATQKHLYRQDRATGEWLRIGNEERRFYAFLTLDDGGFLASTEGGLVRLAPDGSVVETLRAVRPGREQYRKLLRDSKGRMWVGVKSALLRIEGRAGSLRLQPENLPEIRPDENAHAVDMELDNSGRLWVGYANGIAWLDERDQWHKLLADEPVTVVRSLALAGDNIWVAHRRDGAFSRLERSGEKWHVTVFTSNAGYGPIETQFLKRDSRGWIWRGSSDGVHISDGRNVSPTDWLHIDLSNGLAANETGQYGFFEDTDGSIWITGDEGLSHIRPDAKWFDAPGAGRAPQVTLVEADGHVYQFPDSLPATLPQATKVLRIDAGGFGGSPFRDAPLRYRLTPYSHDWNLSRDGTIQFRNLAGNKYSLEIAYAGHGPSPVATYDFRVGPVPLLSSLSWAWPIGFLMLLSALGLMIRYRPRFERARFRIDKALFVLRRRYGRGHVYSSSGASSEAHDYSDATLGGHYHLRRIVSRGGFSVVYDARDLRDGDARLAVKVLNRIPSRRSSNAGWVRDRFAHEVAALRSVEHPGVVRILDSWISSDGEPCLAMPFLEGDTLRAALDRGPIKVPRVARLIRQLGAALAEVHTRGIVHRDLKPENLMLLSSGTDREQLVIIDFGTAGLRSAENELAVTTLMAGSFHYMAPERLTGHYSPASDVFAFGVIVLEMLTGKRLADVTSMVSDVTFREELEDLLRNRMSGGAGKKLAGLLACAYDAEPRRRPASVKTWAEEIAALLDQA